MIDVAELFHAVEKPSRYGLGFKSFDPGPVDMAWMGPVVWNGDPERDANTFPGVDLVPKSPRRLQLEQSLADDPSDAFLRYGLALQCLREGDVEEGRARLRALIADAPSDSVAACQQLGQSYLETGEEDAASDVLRQGIEQARQRGDHHAVAEMEGLLAQLD